MRLTSSRWMAYPATNNASAVGSMATNGSSPRARFSSYAKYAPASTNAPWARLITFITPHTREKPTAISASSPPCSSPYTVACRNWLMPAPRSARRRHEARRAEPSDSSHISSRGAARCETRNAIADARSCLAARPLQRRLGRGLRPHRDRLAALDLDDAHLLGDVLPLRGELQRPEERLFVHCGQCFAHLVGVGGAGLLYGQHQGQAGRGRFGVVVFRLPTAELRGERPDVVARGTEPVDLA